MWQPEASERAANGLQAMNAAGATRTRQPGRGRASLAHRIVNSRHIRPRARPQRLCCSERPSARVNSAIAAEQQTKQTPPAHSLQVGSLDVAGHKSEARSGAVAQHREAMHGDVGDTADAGSAAHVSLARRLAATQPAKHSILTRQGATARVAVVLVLYAGALSDLRAAAGRVRPVFMGVELCNKAPTGQLFCGSSAERTGVLALKTSSVAALGRPDVCRACWAEAARAESTGAGHGGTNPPVCCMATGQANSGPGEGLVVRVHQPIPGDDLSADSLIVACPEANGQAVNVTVWVVVVPATMAQEGQVASAVDTRQSPVRSPSLPLMVSELEDAPPPPPLLPMRCDVAPLGSSHAQAPGHFPPPSSPPLADGVSRFHPLSAGIRVVKGTAMAFVDKRCAVRAANDTTPAQVATLHIRWDGNGYWGLLPGEATPVARKQGVPACIFAVADAGPSVLLPSQEWAARALAFPALGTNGAVSSSLVNLVDRVWLEPETTRSGLGTSTATGTTPDGKGRRMDLPNSTLSGLPKQPDQLSSTPSVQDLSMLSRKWWRDAVTSAAFPSREGATEATANAESPLQLHFAVRNSGWSDSPPERVHIMVFNRLSLASSRTESRAPNGSLFPAWYPHAERAALAKLDAAARVAAQLPRDLGGGGSGANDRPVGDGSPSDDSVAAAALAGAACPAWSAVEPLDPIWAFIPTSSDNATAAPRLVAGRKQFASMLLPRFENDWSVSANGQPQPQARILLLPSVPANSSSVLSVSLTRDDLGLVMGLSRDRHADAGAWGVCFALARAAQQQRPASGGATLLATIVVPRNRLETAWRLSEPIPDPPPNWGPLIGGLLGTTAGVVALAFGYRWAVTHQAALDLADDRADEQRAQSRRAAAAAKEAHRRKWSKNHSLVPAEERPKQPTQDMLQSEAARLVAGDKSLWRPMRASMQSMASGLMFNKKGELTGSVSKEGIVRDMSGARIGYIPGVSPDSALQG